MKKLLVLSFLLSLVSCGGGDPSSTTESKIEELSLRDSTIEPNANTEARVQFSVGGIYVRTDADGEAVFESEPFNLTVILPPKTTYIEGSSKLSDDLYGDVLFGNPDSHAPERTGQCDNGGSYLYYTFRQDQFGDTERLDATGFFLKLGINVKPEANGMSVLAAINAFSPSDPCTIVAEKSAAIVVGS